MTVYIQPDFDSRIKTLQFPLEGRSFGKLKRGTMVWESSNPNLGGKARVNFLYNPATVEASYSINQNVGATLQFPVPGDTSDLRVPLSQTVSWSLLYDRTYELWGAYTPNGTAKKGKSTSDPSVVGVMADIFAMQQFTGMTMGYTTSGKVTNTISATSFAGHQGIMQLIPAYVYFGDGAVLAYFGYVSSWDVTVTHFTQKMIPMRCVIDITFTMLPPKEQTADPGKGFGKTPLPGRPGGGPVIHPGVVAPTSNTGRSGR